MLDTSSNTDISVIGRPCHYHQLFIKNNGDVFPCCNAWWNNKLKIGHITDYDLIDKISKFKAVCTCTNYCLREWGKDDDVGYEQINVELALTCHASCIMCCVNASSTQPPYLYFKELSKLIGKLCPKELFLQGGEILVQPDALAWVRKIRSEYPAMLTKLATNGNAPVQMAVEVSQLFDRFSISFVGFQKETYAKIMGIDIHKTILFVNKLKEMHSTLQLKYLMTPISMHETGLFLKWALSIVPSRILLSDASTEMYIVKDTSDHYWQKIYELVEADIKKIIMSSRDDIAQNNITLAVDDRISKMFNIDINYMHNSGLQHNIIYHKGWS